MQVYLMVGMQLLLLWLTIISPPCCCPFTKTLDTTTSCVFPCLQRVAGALPDSNNGVNPLPFHAVWASFVAYVGNP
jgi:hypothetical protein